MDNKESQNGIIKLNKLKEYLTQGEIISTSTLCDVTEENSPLEDSSINNKFVHYSFSDNIYSPCSITCKTLPSGVYDVILSKGNILFIKKSIKSDEWLPVHSDFINLLIQETKKFWEKRDIYISNKLMHKRGILLHGPAGSGKSILCKQLIKELITDGGVVFICSDPNVLSQGLSLFRKIEPMRKVICLFEDIDTIIRNYGEFHLLELLDGDDSHEYILNIATTNYPENLNPRFISRPRRFDRVELIPYPPDNIRRLFFQYKGMKEGEELDKFVEKTEGFSYSALTELFIGVKILENDFNIMISRLKTLMEIDKNPNSSEYFSNTKNVGFN